MSGKSAAPDSDGRPRSNGGAGVTVKAKAASQAGPPSAGLLGSRGVALGPPTGARPVSATLSDVTNRKGGPQSSSRGEGGSISVGKTVGKAITSQKQAECSETTLRPSVEGELIRQAMLLRQENRGTGGVEGPRQVMT